MTEFSQRLSHQLSQLAEQLVFVVDKSGSYAIWEQKIEELLLAISYEKAKVVQIIVVETLEDGTLRPTGEVNNSFCERQAVLILSDCVGESWADGSWYELCKKWGEFSPVLVLQLLPTYLWRRTKLGNLSRAWISPTNLANPLNSDWRFSNYSGLEEDDDDSFEILDGFPVPVVPLDLYPISVLAKAMRGESTVELTSYFLTTISKDLKPKYCTAQERFNSFCKTASIKAQRLAALLSAIKVPISPSSAYFIQEEILKWEKDSTQIAEIFLSGLVYEGEFFADSTANIRLLLNQTLPESELASTMCHFNNWHFNSAQ